MERVDKVELRDDVSKRKVRKENEKRRKRDGDGWCLGIERVILGDRNQQGIGRGNGREESTGRWRLRW